nr:class I SAM-dependent methyltransferase [Streptomyces sp. SID5789]
MQARYWDSLAETYDQVYDSPWSVRENALVASRLTSLVPPRERCTVLELGCGTGLGYDLLIKNTTAKISYTGIDVSSGMLGNFERKYPSGSIRLLNAPVEEMQAHQFQDVDLVIAIFTSASYVRLPLESLLWKILKWLKPKGGRLYLSFLNRVSLKLSPRWGIRSEIKYASRRTSGGVVPAFRYSKTDLLRAAGVYGLKVKIVSLGPLSGLLELPLAWPLNRLFADFTLGSHTIEMIR